MKIFQTTLQMPAVLALFAILPLRRDDPKRPHDTVPLPKLSSDPNDPHAEMRRLFGKIERDLREIDRLLADASAGGADASPETKKKAAEVVLGLQKLLDSSEEHGKSVVAGIDRILELAQHEPTSSSSCESAGGLCKSAGSSGSSSSGSAQNRRGSQKEPGQGDSSAGKSPLDRQGENTTQREATPQGPEKTPANGDRDPQDNTSKGKPGSPGGNEASRAAARNAPASSPPGSITEETHPGAASADKWGDLPLHVRDVFRAQGGGDMPAQYRDWIDAYYRRMARRSGS